MKNLFLTSAVLFLAFIIGCQESSITDPTQPFAENKDPMVNIDDQFQGKPEDVNHNIIGLKYELADPGSPEASQLNGQVQYETSSFLSIGNSRKVKVKVKLQISAELSKSRGIVHPLWKIEDKSEDYVVLSDTDPQTKKLSKAYSITNRDDVKLHVTYLITSKRVQIVDVFLRSSGIGAMDFD